MRNNFLNKKTMKKLILTLVFTIYSLVSFSQTLYAPCINWYIDNKDKIELVTYYDSISIEYIDLSIKTLIIDYYLYKASMHNKDLDIEICETYFNKQKDLVCILIAPYYKKYWQDKNKEIYRKGIDYEKKLLQNFK